MSHIALYRSWRPQSFRDVVGQAYIVQTLQHSLSNGRITHAYLFSGPRGTGKTTTARIMAKALNCEQGPAAEPCNVCSTCERITEGSVMDVIEIDAASNRRVEEARQLLEQVRYTPTEVRYKVYIIDEVHMLTTEAFNTLLKTLEEPPAHVIFILATTDPNRLPATIISRCQRFEFRRVSNEAQVERLAYICEQEKIEVETDALQLIARLSRGGMRDALSLLDQLVSYASGQITYEHVVEVTGGLDDEQFQQLAAAIHAGDVGSVLDQVTQLMSSGKSVDRAIESLIHYYRDLLFVKLLPDSDQLTDRMIDAERFAEMAAKIDEQSIFAAIDTLNHYYAEMKFAAQPQTLFEVAVLRLCTAVPIAKAGAPAALATATGAAMPASGEVASGATIPSSASPGTVTPGTSRAASSAAAPGVVPSAGARTSMTTGDATAASDAVTPAPAPSVGSSAGSSVAPDEPPRSMPDVGSRTASSGSPSTSMPSTASRTAPSSAPSGAPSAMPNATMPVNQARSAPSSHRGKYDAFLAARDDPSFQALASRWSDVLAEVRKRRITVHAWLVDGTPVAVADQSVLVAFKNEIHCVTTGKPDNKQLIEQVMHDVLGQPMQLETIMRNDWKDLLPKEPTVNQSDLTEEQFALEPEPESESTGQHQEPWINKAIELFGEQLVTIEEDTPDDHEQN